MLDDEGDPLTKNIASASGKPSQPRWPFHPVADFSPNGSHAIQTSLHGPSLGHANYNDFFVSEQYRYLLISRRRLSLHQRAAHLCRTRHLPSVEMPSVEINFNPPAPLSFLPTEAVSTSASFAPTSSFSPPTPLLQLSLPSSSHVCAICSKTFGRATEVQRHATIHDRRVLEKGQTDISLAE